MKPFLLLGALLSLLHASDPAYLNEETSDFAFTPTEAHSFASVGFRISGGAIRVNALGGWADGEYVLREADITPTDTPNTFVADLTFAKKKGSFSFSHNEKIGLLYDGYRLWIKYRERIYRYGVPAPVQSIERDHNRITTQIAAPFLDTAFENITLRFEF